MGIKNETCQTLVNVIIRSIWSVLNYRLCQVQLTTAVTSGLVGGVLFINYVNVLFRGIGRVRNRLNNLRPVGRGLGATMVNLSSLLFSILQRRRGILSPALLVVFTTE